jgi:UDP-N-acetylglucosamine--N-acetylmuramyl-(pentapeptide) pyrophosphoryl-undecaprenol N-acetylglucosamine transferase
MKILFAGGGSLGPVTPLIATARALARLEKNLQFFWIGTPTGPERALAEAEGMQFSSLPVVKLPRYPSLKWLTLPFDWLRVRHLAAVELERVKPDVIVSVGGFTATPVMIEAVRRGIPCVMHQLDLRPGLSNRRVAKLCSSVTTSFEYERPPFGEWVSDERIASPVRFQRADLPTRTAAARHFGLDSKQPVTLISGGGTGAQALNQHVGRTIAEWLKLTQVIHLTGRGKSDGLKERPGYVVRELLVEDMGHAYALADLAVSRAGFASLAEMTASLAIPTIAVPLPGTEQEENARAFEEQKALIVVEQSHPRFDDEVLSAARLMLSDADICRELGENAQAFLPTDDGTALARRVLKALKNSMKTKTI